MTNLCIFAIDVDLTEAFIYTTSLFLFAYTIEIELIGVFF